MDALRASQDELISAILAQDVELGLLPLVVDQPQLGDARMLVLNELLTASRSL